MNTINLGRHKFLQPKEHLSFLEKVTQNYIQGCLQALSISQSLSLYFEQGQLIYAYQANNMWDIFCQKLQQLFPQLNNLNNELDGQLKAVFESQASDRSDYLAICWLVDQKYLNSLQAGKLIEEIAVGVLDSFFQLREGTYKFIPQSLPDYLPKFCHIDVSLLARRYQLRSLNLTNMSNIMQLANPSEIKLFSDLDQRKVNSKQLFIPNLMSGSRLITQDIEDTTIQCNKSNDHKIEPKCYKVLCIDDSPAILKAIKGFLDEQIFTVISVDNSLKALMQILRTKPDIILLDISMPNLDGYELCSLLRKHSDFRNTPVVMVTGRTGFIDRARAKMVKASGYLSKPFSKADLLKVVFSKIDYKS